MYKIKYEKTKKLKDKTMHLLCDDLCPSENLYVEISTLRNMECNYLQIGPLEIMKLK